MKISAEEIESLKRGIRQLERDKRRRVWYHLTDKSNLESIKKRGLLPSGRVLGVYGFGEASLEDIEGKIFLGSTKEEALRQLRINRFIGLPIPSKEDRVLLQVRLPEGYEVGRDDNNYAYVEDPIPPEYLKVVTI